VKDLADPASAALFGELLLEHALKPAAATTAAAITDMFRL
jgi:hypothetical protein